MELVRNISGCPERNRRIQLHTSKLDNFQAGKKESFRFFSNEGVPHGITKVVLSLWRFFQGKEDDSYYQNAFWEQ